MSFPREPWTSWQPADTVLIPVGSVEQHGPHLAFTTDTDIAQVVCADAAEQRHVDVAPPLHFSSSGEHQGFRGVLSLGAEVTEAAISELIRSARLTWRHVIIVCGHGGNHRAVMSALRTCESEGASVAAWFTTEPDGDLHAGATETSIVAPWDLDVLERPVDDVPIPPDWLDVWMRDGLPVLSPTGVLGEPSRATVAQGHETRARWCAEVVSLIDEREGRS